MTAKQRKAFIAAVDMIPEAHVLPYWDSLAVIVKRAVYKLRKIRS